MAVETALLKAKKKETSLVAQKAMPKAYLTVDVMDSLRVDLKGESKAWPTAVQLELLKVRWRVDYLDKKTDTSKVHQ